MSDDDNVVEEAIEQDDKLSRRGRLGWVSITVAILFGLLYAYDVFEALSNLLDLPTVYTALGKSEATPWWLLIGNLLVPVVVYGIAFVVGLRHRVASKALLFLVGLTIVAVLSLDATAIAAKLLGSL